MPKAPSQKVKAKVKRGQRLRTDAQIKKDRAEIAGRILKGQEIVRISAEMDIPYELVRLDIRRIQEEWDKSALRDFDAAKEEAVLQLKDLQAVYWDAFDRSRRERVRTTERREVVGKKKTRMKIVDGSTMKEELYGDPRFLLGVRQCIMDIAKIRGVIQDSRPSDSAPIIPPSNHATVIIMPQVNPPRPIPTIPVAATVRQVTAG